MKQQRDGGEVFADAARRVTAGGYVSRLSDPIAAAGPLTATIPNLALAIQSRSRCVVFWRFVALFQWIVLSGPQA